MKKTLLVGLALGALCPLAARAQDPRAALEAAATALGTASLESIRVSGVGSDYLFGQAYDGESPWPRFAVPSYTLTIDYTAPALLDERTRIQAENPPRGGAQPLLGQQRQIWAMNGVHAWNLVGQDAIPAGADRDQRTAVEARQAQIWLTPHGFIKAAMASRDATGRAMTVRGVTKIVISFTTPTGVKLTGILDEQNLVEQIETWLHSPVLGNTRFEAVFSDYKDFGGVKYPAHIVQREGGYPVLDITVTDVKRNVGAAIEVPASIRQAGTRAPAAIELDRLEDGIWIAPGGAKSIVVEFRDHIVVIEAPASEARSIAVIDAVGKAIPDKPIRYVINTHAHFDHAGGLRTYAAAGATVITWAGNIPYFEQVWTHPRTINPDRLAQSGRKPVFEGVVGSRILSDGSRNLVIYHYGAGNAHNPGMLMVFLPAESILIQADSFSPAASPHQPVGAGSGLVHFYESVERLRLGVGQIIPIHGPRVASMGDLRMAVEVFKGMSGTQ